MKRQSSHLGRVIGGHYLAPDVIDPWRQRRTREHSHLHSEKQCHTVDIIEEAYQVEHWHETVPDCSKNCSISQGTDKDHSKDYTLVFWVIYIMLRCVLTHWLFSVITLWTIHLCLMDYWVAWAIPPYCGGPFIQTGPLSQTVTPCHHPILEGPYYFWNVVSHWF